MEYVIKLNGGNLYSFNAKDKAIEAYNACREKFPNDNVNIYEHTETYTKLDI